MADRSPAFNPSPNTVPVDGKDPMIVKVDETQAQWASRKSAQPSLENDTMGIKHVQNGR